MERSRQKRVIEEALLVTDIKPETITYVEANGTGTLLGDSMEIEALARVYRTQTDKKEFCGIGSVKTNVGHLTQAAGIAALIKTALSLKYRQLFPSLNCETPNPGLKGSPFYVVQEASEWEARNSPRRAGLNSFAIGGTNAHMILEEAPSVAESAGDEDGGSFHILTVSAKNETALERLIARYQVFLESGPDCSIGDICFTSNIGRSHYPVRLSAVTDSKELLYEQLSTWRHKKKAVPGIAPCSEKAAVPKIAFIFSGLSGDFTHMDPFFYEKHPGFRETIDLCATILKSLHGRSLLSDLFRNSGTDVGGYEPTTVFAVEYALFKMWESWGVGPLVVTGHGVGEYVAACAAGVLSVEDGIRLVMEGEDLPRAESGKAECADGSLFEDAAGGTRPSSSAIELVSTESDYFREQRVNLYILIGPNRNILDSVLKHNPVEGRGALQSFRGDADEWRQILGCLGELYARGGNIDWRQITTDFKCRRIPLPTYPFDKKPCWFNG